MTNEKLDIVEDAGQRLRVTIDAPERARMREELLARAQRERRQRVAMAAAALMLVLAGGAWAAAGAFFDPDTDAPTMTAGPEPIRFADGSEVQPEEGGQVHVSEAGKDRIRVELAKGKARFVITPNKARSFEVEAQDVTVRVLGTVFEVERVDGEVSVIVEEGRVQVTGPHGELILTRGERAKVPERANVAGRDDSGTLAEGRDDSGTLAEGRDDSGTLAEGRDDSGTLAAERDRPVRKRKPKARKPDWRRLYEDRKFAEAADALVPPERLRRVDDLMDAAEIMRIARRPERALAYLERVRKTSRKDPRVPMADFTRARMLLGELGRPAKAAKIFRDIHRQHPSSSFAEQSLAREVEAWAKAGERGKARDAAEQYMAQYPSGKYTKIVKFHGDMP